MRRRAVRARTRTVQRKENCATEDRAAAAACTPKPGGSLRCSSLPARTPRLPKVSGLAWTPAPRYPGCARSAPRPLLMLRPCRGCGSLSRAFGGSGEKSTRSWFPVLGTEETVEGGNSLSLRFSWCRPSRLDAAVLGAACGDLGGASRLAYRTTYKSLSLFHFEKRRAWFLARTFLLLTEVSRATVGCDLGQREEGCPGSVC